MDARTNWINVLQAALVTMEMVRLCEVPTPMVPKILMFLFHLDAGVFCDTESEREWIISERMYDWWGCVIHEMACVVCVGDGRMYCVKYFELFVCVCVCCFRVVYAVCTDVRPWWYNWDFVSVMIQLGFLSRYSISLFQLLALVVK